KRDRPGGNSSLSTGSVPAANSRFQREAGIVDDPATMVADLMRIARETDDLDLVRRMAEVSAETVEWLVDTVGARLVLITAYKHIGHSIQRLHAPVSRRGQDLVDDLLAAIESRGIPLAVGNSVKDLIVEDGAVVGAMADAGDGPFALRARKTILAVNGFAADAALVRQYCPEIAGAQYFGAQGSHGEAIRWGISLGAELANMGAYQGYAAVAYPHGSLLSWTTIEKGGMLVGADAKRFGDESLGYSGFARVVLEQGEYAFAVFDQKIFEIAAQEEEFMELVRYGGVKQAADIAALAALLELDGAELARQVEAFNHAAREEIADPFGRKDFGLGALTGPFYGCRVVPGLFHTQGGLKVDRDARVLGKNGAPIPGLFAGGGAAAGISGKAGALGYASTALGRLAGLAAAAEIGRDAS
ncbi:MAG: FAD-binding protein, partial [Bosea sp. (in: a-proteobacteria)]